MSYEKGFILRSFLLAMTWWSNGKVVSLLHKRLLDQIVVIATELFATETRKLFGETTSTTSSAPISSPTFKQKTIKKRFTRYSTQILYQPLWNTKLSHP